jgi:hypothetical protein
MEKDTLIKIILQDINELETLVGAFSGQTDASNILLQLAKSKSRGILEKLEILDKPSTGNSDTLPKQQEKSSPETIVITPSPEITEKQEDKKTPEPTPAKKEEIIEIEPETKSIPVKEERKEVPVFEKPPQQPLQQKQNGSGLSSGKSDKQNGVIGDMLGRDKHSYNEMIGQKSESDNTSKFRKPIDDLRKALGINDRFFYQRELFGGNNELFTRTLDQLNSMESFESANAFLSANFNWDDKAEAVVTFKEVVKMRYIKH